MLEPNGRHSVSSRSNQGGERLPRIIRGLVEREMTPGGMEKAVKMRGCRMRRGEVGQWID
ncbi:hypothetical protein J6590_077848 [Homalodisca vitripennis]|nr:hypothetical protein J6590_077848 [Homalodisca vitripennis]